MAAISAAAIAIVATTLRQGEAEFLQSMVRPLAAVALIPALFMLFQVVPLRIRVRDGQPRASSWCRLVTA